MYKVFSILIVFLFFSMQINAQRQKSADAHIIGHVMCCNEHVPFVTIFLEGTTVGTTTDETGHFQLLNMVPGTYTLLVRSVGYKTHKQEVVVEVNKTKEIKIELEQDVLGLDEVVITGDRNETNRREASVIVSTISPKNLKVFQAVTLSDGLNFASGLRTENNCQNCGFNQVRMNGMEGAYSQVLINSRQIFSGLAGVYGLELIPTNMIERVEIVRGGGSALYGSSAIAGTINLILKDPISNSYELDVASSTIGLGVKDGGALGEDYTAKFNTSLISSDSKTGMSLYGFYRNRTPYDANDDSFSELASIENATIGSRLFHRFSNRSRISLDLFNINENRRGGDKHNAVFHESTITEALKHQITTGALEYNQLIREHDELSVYVSAQGVDRDSYYGAGQSLSDYGKTTDLSYVAGAQYHLHIEKSELTMGAEYQGAQLKDTKLGYPDIDNAEYIISATDTTLNIPHTNNVTIADQESHTMSVFAQYQIRLNRLKATLGGRFDNYEVVDNEASSKKTGNVFSPRITMLYDVMEFLQARVSYGQGYRAPQIFDEDLHIETSQARKVIHTNDPNLTQETSHSFMASLDFSRRIGNVSFGILAEGFYTHLEDAFANEYSDPNAAGVVTFTRVNAEKGAKVMGINTEFNVVPYSTVTFKAGFTYQISRYEETQAFDNKDFVRTPGDYGFATIDWEPNKRFGASITGNYTGKMYIEYFGNTLADPEAGELRETDSFLDMGLKARFNTKINGATLQVYAGLKNVFNSYQNDFDSGETRDPGYVYGPQLPRTVYIGVKIGNLIR